MPKKITSKKTAKRASTKASSSSSAASRKKKTSARKERTSTKVTKNKSKTQAPVKAIKKRATQATKQTTNKKEDKKIKSSPHKIQKKTKATQATQASEQERVVQKFPGHIQDIEPSPEELNQESHFMGEAHQQKAKIAQVDGSIGKDVLSMYMDQLAHIPLFNANQEIESAKHLEHLDLTLWNLILKLPKAMTALLEESAKPREQPWPQSTILNIEQMVLAYRRLSASSRKASFTFSKNMKETLQSISKDMRFLDHDRDIQESLISILRHEAWERRVFDGHPAFRVTHAQLTEIEQARGLVLRSRNDFVRANLRLVVSVARHFHHYRVPLIDLIQEGNVGLMKAVHRYDHRRGFRFSTYAHWWIRQSIERSIINKGSQVRLPVHIIDARRLVQKTSNQLAQKLKRMPTIVEIAAELKEEPYKIDQILAGIQQDPVSLDESVGGDDPRKFVDLLEDENTPGPDEALIRENTYDRIRELLMLLNPIERDIIRRRFGIGEDTDQTLDEIGKTYNLSRERVRQIQSQGLAKMRRMCERRRIG